MTGAPTDHPRRLLLTGGAGYVGSACLRYLLERGHDPIAYDDLSAGNRAAVPGDRLVEGDIRDPTALARAIREHRAEVVMHFAALASVPESIDEPDRYWDVNVLGTLRVLDAMRAAGCGRLVFSSTAATYAFDVPMPITEATPQVPRTPYGTTKLAAETLIREHVEAFGLGATVLRYFNAAGADPSGAHGECRAHETHLIPLVLSVAAGARATFSICGTDWETSDGTCVRDYVHVRDLARAHELAADAVAPGTFRAYNCGTGRGTSVREVLRACEQATGTPIACVEAPRRPGDPATLVASGAAIRSDLGWTPEFADIDSIVATAWRWHASRPHGYRAGVPE